ncbi:MAG: preprotein translocase subunit SecG [Sphingomonas bacterium]|jgi:protein translocase SecG subunit|nr:preprotein translocase subunit SecG [Sphingomonas bacterium]
MFTFLLVVHAIIAAALVTVILMQRSEGGGLGMGSGPSGLMSARGAADFLTRATSVLAALFVLMAFALAAYASMRDGTGQIDTSLAHQTAPGAINAPLPATPTSNIPMMGTPGLAAPDAATSQALAPASAGPPTVPAKTGALPVIEHPHRPAPTVSSLKTIDTKQGSASIGINGVSSQPASGNSAHGATPPVVTAPASKPATTPTLNIAPPAAGNGATPQ